MNLNETVKFRGKRKEYKDLWVYGYASRFIGSWQIYDDYEENDSNDQNSRLVYEVHPESIGKYIGLKDINGIEIYSTDILSDSKDGNYSARYAVLHDEENAAFKLHQIAFIDGELVYGQINIMNKSLKDFILENKLQVIGNTFDNSEMLEAKTAIDKE